MKQIQKQTGRNELGQFIAGHTSILKGKKINTNLGIINCSKCEKEIIKTGGMKKYCDKCRKIVDVEKVRKYEGKNPKKMREWQKTNAKNQRDKFPKKIFARSQANIHIELKPCCEICKSTNNLQRHHWNYDKPLLVNTLCSTCHQIQHVKQFNKSCFRGGN